VFNYDAHFFDSTTKLEFKRFLFDMQQVWQLFLPLMITNKWRAHFFDSTTKLEFKRFLFDMQQVLQLFFLLMITNKWRAGAWKGKPMWFLGYIVEVVMNWWFLHNNVVIMWIFIYILSIFYYGFR